MVAGCLLLALQVSLAQKAPAVSPAATRELLVGQAHELEARGRPDMAAQLWQQILLSDPKNQEAMEGLARDYKLIGSAQKANEALEQLRSAYPNDPNIPRIEALTSTQIKSGQLTQAGELAREGKSADAMRIYRDLYGDHPPDGAIALAYYETLYGTPGGRAPAIAAMRALAARNPGDTRYPIELGTMLTYSPDTRDEGIRILEEHRNDPTAEAALRQALIWNAANPASAAELEAYLRTHPQDQEIARLLAQDRAQLAKMNAGIARTPAEVAAFAALNAHRLDDAEARFNAILREQPNNGRAAAGMGFLRMQQKNFGAAIAYLNQAEQDGFKARVVDDALQTSRFWYTMGEATQAFNANHLDVAAAKYREALVMKPRSPEALNGLGGLFIEEKQYSTAADVYQQLVGVQPGDADGWRGLFLAYAQDGQNDKALAVQARFPASVRIALDRDPEYLSALATIYQAQGRTADAQRVLALALSLPFPKNGATLQAGTKLQYAGILMAVQRYDQAAALYEQILNADPSNLSAWEGLISAHHSLGMDTQAIADIRRMPSATYESALGDSGFLALLGSIYQQANQLDVAQSLLERAVRVQLASGAQPAIQLQLQLAGIYLKLNDTTRAYALYRQILTAHPDRTEAWKGLISTLLATNRDQQALDEIAVIPPAVRRQLEADIDFMQAEASLYAATGDIPHAAQYMNAVNAHYARLRMEPPANIAIQSAWLLYNTHSDRSLYLALMHLGARGDLTVAQRETVQQIWAEWSVRRAGEAMDNNDPQNAIEILDAALQAFPNNMTVRMAVAGGYSRVGRAKEAVALFKTIPMQDATAGDFEGAIGAALAANDMTRAEIWLRRALDRYGRDPAILALAARYEQARGDNQRAVAYWRASLAAMPQTSPTDRLAHELVYPEEDVKVHRAVTAADLQRLLNPDNEPFARTTKLPPLPAYGPDPYAGSAPVMLPSSDPAQQPASEPQPQANPPMAPPTGELELPPPPPASSAPKPAALEQAPGNPSFFAPATVKAAEYMPEPIHSAQRQAYGQPHLSYATFHPRAQHPRFLLAAAAAPQAAPEAAQEAAPDQAQLPGRDGGAAPGDLSQRAPHSLASDAWKGLVFSLMAAGRDQEAIEEIGKIPPEIRRILDVDLDFVQGEASLYLAVGDRPRAFEYLNEVENYYAVRGGNPPAALEVQHAWLLYNLSDSRDLYPLLLRLDARLDLSAAERQQIDNLWASWAVRRAETALNSGDTPLGIELLDAASQDYPDSLAVRTAVAGAYAKLGRADDAVALFKTIPLQNAGPADLEAAVSAALAAHNMAQAQTWLQQALSRFPGDPRILEAAARFEQAHGDEIRAAAYWRAAIAALPPGASAVPSLDSSLPAGYGNAPETWQEPAPGETKRLLNPNRIGEQTALPPLPGASVTPVAGHQLTGPGGLPLFIPPSPAQQSQQSDNQPMLVNQPDLVQQSATHRAVMVPAVNRNVNCGISPAGATVCISAISGRPIPNVTLRKSMPPVALRISAQPMSAMAAEVQALFAQQTDGQLSQGFAATIHAAPAGGADESAAGSAIDPVGQSVRQPAPDADSAAVPRFVLAQYTPSAQEAATGAYSSPRSQTAEPNQMPPAAQIQPPVAPRKKRRRRRKSASTETIPAAPPSATPTLGNNPPVAPNPQQGPIPEQAPAPAPSTTNSGLTDQELEQRNLPPLTGPWVRVQREQRPLSPREQAEEQLQGIESGYSGWLGGTGLLNYRSGNLGYDHLSALEAPFEASVPLGYNARFTIIAKPVFLDSGQANGNAVITVDESTTAGTTLVTIPEPIGTDTNTSASATAGAGIPPQQNASGIAGEAQLAFPHLSIAGGYTPAGFLVATFTARAYWRPGNGPFTFSFDRDSETDSQLSYSGLRDPAGNSLGTLGAIWGGVVYNYGRVQFSRGTEQSGYYIGAGGQYLTGYNVETNTRIEGSGGAYWHVYTMPEYGHLSIGANFFGMHYDNNQDAFTYGMGGYFSPQAYFLANIPFTWVGNYGTRWHYNILGGLGIQAFQEDETPLWPLAGQKAIETAQNNPMLPALTSVGPNYDLRGNVAYQIGPHWFAGGFFGANNTRNYAASSVGFYVRFMFRSQPSEVTSPTGIFPVQGLRPFTVP